MGNPNYCYNGISLSQKADKVRNAANGNLAGLDASGNLTDSGVSAAQALILDGEVNTYADLPTPAAGNDGQVYLVKTTTGIRFVNQKPAGFWVSNAVIWSLIAPIGDTIIYSDLAAVAFSGSATDLASGTLNNARLPSPISIAGTITGSQLISTIATGTAPLSVTSTTQVANLNAATAGNASTATALQNARTIGGVSFDGTANIVPQTIQSVNEASDTTCYPLFITASGSQSLQPKNNTSLKFNASTGALSATSFVGDGSLITGVTAVEDQAMGYIASWTTSSSGANQVPTGGVLAYNNSPSAITTSSIDGLKFNLTETGTYIIDLFFWKDNSASVAQVYPAVTAGGTSTTPALSGSTLRSVSVSGTGIMVSINLIVSVTAATVTVQPKFSQSASVSTTFLGITYKITKVA